MDLQNIYLPEELIINILQFLEFRDIKNLYKTNLKFKEIISHNYHYVFKNSKINSIKIIYSILISEINQNLDIEKKFNYLINNYQYEKRRLYVINTENKDSLYPYEDRISVYGFLKFRNYTKFRRSNFCEYASFLLASSVPEEKIHLIYFLRKESFNESHIIDIISRKSVEDIYCLVSLVRAGFRHSFSIKCNDDLDFDQMQSLFLLKKAGFPSSWCYHIPIEHSKQQINKILMLINQGFNYGSSYRCSTRLSEEKFLILMKLKNKFSDLHNLFELVNNTSIRNLNVMLNHK